MTDATSLRSIRHPVADRSNPPRRPGASTIRACALALLLASTVACTAGDGKPGCDSLYASHYGRQLIRASEDPSEPWKRAGYHSPSAWAHARAAAVVEGEKRSRLCR
jgi:hypothetical protein